MRTWSGGRPSTVLASPWSGCCAECFSSRTLCTLGTSSCDSVGDSNRTIRLPEKGSSLAELRKYVMNGEAGGGCHMATWSSAKRLQTPTPGSGGARAAMRSRRSLSAFIRCLLMSCREADQGDVGLQAQSHVSKGAASQSRSCKRNPKPSPPKQKRQKLRPRPRAEG